MTKVKISRRDVLRGMLALGAAGAAAAVAGTALTAAPAEAAQIHMDIALGTLNTALGKLQSAIPDKGGYRVKAIAAVKTAIAEVEAGFGQRARLGRAISQSKPPLYPQYSPSKPILFK